MPSYCSVPNCTNNSKTSFLHIFPKNQELYEIWCRNIGREDLIEKDPIQFRGNYRVCDIHFDEKSKNILKRNPTNLKPGSIPTLNLSGPGISENTHKDDHTTGNKLETTRILLQLPYTITIDQGIGGNTLQVDVPNQKEESQTAGISLHTPDRNRIDEDRRIIEGPQYIEEPFQVQETEAKKMKKSNPKTSLLLKNIIDNVNKFVEVEQETDESSLSDDDFSALFDFPAAKKKKKSNSKTSLLPKNIIDDVNKFVQASLDVLRAPKDDCEVFGQYVASELRQVSSLKRRERLKRSIKRLMEEENDI